MDKLKQQMDFLLEIDKEKKIGRQTYIADGSRKENDAEHAWHMAMFALILQEYAGEAVDIGRVLSMILIHDVVEIDAGDTYAYDEDAKKTQKEREEKAAERIFGMLPELQRDHFLSLWHEFEEGTSADAKYAVALDRLQPMMLNAAAGGKSWKEHGVTLSQILVRNHETAKNTEALWEYSFNEFVKPHVEKGNIKG
ncbi:HD domain-containing protein [Ohessyouella blattaphilus]|uniref:HD domain-containing protein n=1 Tax=Ohessyouella blattaphilus TaxID=2949333 RepID=A0ABT1EHL9_9FIRM|nr:HD domain-containing protein [Ohessyouella blattaphilus]MCP1110186.1 HD domain-containing protein [Ohessyouella blattaphilus]MCR8563580.1 HD domain-containing protein [Ohessyouella blattaphilus]